MNFNNILIGSEDAPRLVAYYSKLLGEPTMADGSGPTRRSTAGTRRRAG